MKPATMAPVYAYLYPRLAERARGLGYALALHGTLGRDFDLLAAPWTEEAVAPADLVEALAEQCNGYVATEAREAEGEDFTPLPRHCPHGRLGFLIFMRSSSGYLDVSVMPLRPSPGGGEEG